MYCGKNKRMIWEFFLNFYRLYRYMIFLFFIFPYMNFRRMISVYVYFQLKLENANSEEEMIAEWKKMNINKIYLQNASKVELKYIMKRMVEKGYKRLMTEIIQNPRMKFPDYYEIFVLLEREGWEDVRNVFLELPRVQMHMKRFVEKRNEKMDSRVGYRIKNMEEEEECAICLELLKKDERIIECKTCRLKLDVKCWKNWIREEKNQCLMCRSLWFHENQKTKEWMKWTEYKSNL